MLRSSRNCSVIWVAPSTLVELIESSPAINENCPSRGVATLDAMVSASAPGRDAFTTIVGKSTFGSSFTGREKYPNRPASKKASMTRMVMTGRLMKTSQIFMSSTHNGAGMPLFDNARARQSVAWILVQSAYQFIARADSCDRLRRRQTAFRFQGTAHRI